MPFVNLHNLGYRTISIAFLTDTDTNTKNFSDHASYLSKTDILKKYKTNTENTNCITHTDNTNTYFHQYQYNQLQYLNINTGFLSTFSMCWT